MQTLMTDGPTWQPVELRRAGPRTYTVRIVPYGETTARAKGEPSGERFQPGSFADWLTRNGRASVALTARHYGPRVGQVGRLTELRDGLYGEIVLDSSASGEQAAGLINSGAVAVSVGFVARSERRDTSGRTVIMADLDHLALVGTDGAYQGARIMTGTKGHGSPFVVGTRAAVDHEPEWPARWASS